MKVDKLWYIVDIQHIDKVFQDDLGRRSQTGACLLTRLHHRHFMPCSFERMRVSFATAMISEAVLTALKRSMKAEYRGTIAYVEAALRFRIFFTENVISTANAIPLETEVRAIAKIFEIWETDMDSVPTKPETRKRGSKNWPSLLPKEVLSDATNAMLEVLRVSKAIVYSVPSSYIHIEWVNQDPLENVFGQKRGSVGSSNNPTYREWLQSNGRLRLRQHRHKTSVYTESALVNTKPRIKRNSDFC